MRYKTFNCSKFLLFLKRASFDGEQCKKLSKDAIFTRNQIITCFFKSDLILEEFFVLGVFQNFDVDFGLY